MFKAAWLHKMTVVVWLMSVVMVWVTLISCDRRLPTRPPKRDLKTLGTIDGTMGGGDTVYQSTVYSDPITKEVISVFNFADIKGKFLAKADLTSATDLLALLNGTTFNIPGDTYVDIGGWFTIRVIVTTQKARPTYYQVQVVNMETSESVTYLFPKNSSLAKDADLEEEEDAQALNKQLFISTLSSHSALLCLGPDEVLIQAQTCLRGAPSYCSRRGVLDAYLQGSLSIANGCIDASCKIICKNHDQGVIGF